MVPVHEVPATYGGLSEANIKNALAAILIDVRERCQSGRHPSGAQDLRRFLLPHAGPSKHDDGARLPVLLDYAHNIAAYETMARFVARNFKARALGVIACPGD